MGSNQLNSFIKYDRNTRYLSIKSGDLIEIKRLNYNHWAIVEKVDQFIVWCFHVQVVGHSEMRSAAILYEPLLDILKDNNKESLFRVNNQEEMASKLMNENNIHNIPDIEQLFVRLHSMKDKLVKYDVKHNNCEHYVTLWKYGIGWSAQVKDYETGIKVGATGFGLSLMMRGNFFVGATVMAIGFVADKVLNLANPDSLSSSSQGQHRSSQAQSRSPFDRRNLNQSSHENYLLSNSKELNRSDYVDDLHLIDNDILVQRMTNNMSFTQMNELGSVEDSHSYTVKPVYPQEDESKWFLPHCSRENAERLLMGRKIGTFLVRGSHQMNENFILSIVVRDHIRNIVINKTNEGYSLCGIQRHPTLKSLIMYYSNPLNEDLNGLNNSGTNLKFPVFN